MIGNLFLVLAATHFLADFRIRHIVKPNVLVNQIDVPKVEG